MIINEEMMINYLQSKLKRVQKGMRKYGIEDRVVSREFDSMIACKEMVEALIHQPVNLGKDGKVTVGF